jgi:hypothetical protein
MVGVGSSMCTIIVRKRCAAYSFRCRQSASPPRPCADRCSGRAAVEAASSSRPLAPPTPLPSARQPPPCPMPNSGGACRHGVWQNRARPPVSGPFPMPNTGGALSSRPTPLVVVVGRVLSRCTGRHATIRHGSPVLAMALCRHGVRNCEASASFVGHAAVSAKPPYWPSHRIGQAVAAAPPSRPRRRIGHTTRIGHDVISATMSSRPRRRPNYYTPSQRDADDKETTINPSYYSPNHSWFPA